MNTLRSFVIASAVAALIASCSDFHAKEERGGETHFLMACTEDACPSGLECVCGVCTSACVGDSACAGLGDDTACLELTESTLLCEGETPATRICDDACERDADCGSLGEDFMCVDSRCRPEEVASQIATGSGDAAVPDGPIDPLMFIVLDTSGSMERRANCTCTTASCNECLPDCSDALPAKNRWTQALEALTGTYEEFSCQKRERESFASYDRDYPIPHHEPMGTQADDGVLDVLRDRVRFGIATFDAIGSYDRDTQRSLAELDFARSQGEYGQWSYPETQGLTTRPDGSIRGDYSYPGGVHRYWMDTGIRSASADHGALIAAIDPALSDETANAIKSTVLRARPYGGTPTAAALDDLYWYFASDPATAPERADLRRKRHVVLITDGRPDDDYRSSGCNCNEPGESCEGLLLPTESPDEMVCPYPAPERTAHNLRCGFSDECDDGVVNSVYVIGFAVSDDPLAVDRVVAIADEGGTTALFANDSEELRTIFMLIADRITDQSGVSDGDACTVERAPDLTYAHGATWQRACNRCECNDGQVSCTRVACTDCREDADCGDGEACHFGWLTCEQGQCGPAAVEGCDGPIDSQTMCTCDGETVTTIDCNAMMTGIADTGPCP